jgi:putative acetyltransferase
MEDQGWPNEDSKIEDARLSMSNAYSQMSPSLVVRREDITAPVVQELFCALNHELSLLYPEQGANHFGLDADEVALGEGGLFVAFDGDTPVGCSVIRRLDAETAELKRMYVVGSARRKGVALELMRITEDEARRLGVSRLVLETGDRQPEAVALALKLGFVRVPRFGRYIDSPLSVCMEKRLGSS